MSFFNIKPHVKAIAGTPLLKLCSLFADTYGREGYISKIESLKTRGQVKRSIRQRSGMSAIRRAYFTDLIKLRTGRTRQNCPFYILISQ